MAREGGFFSPNRKVTGKDKQVASSGFTQIDDTSFLDRDDDYKNEMNSIYGEKRYQKLPGFIKKDIKLDYLDKNPIKYKKFLDSSFAPSGNELGQIASATTDLSGLSDEDNYRAYMKEQGIRYPKTLSPMFHRLNKENMMQDIQEGRFKDGQFFNRAPVDTDTKVAMGDNLGGYAAAIGGLGSMAIMGANAIKNTIQNIAPNFQKKYRSKSKPRRK